MHQHQASVITQADTATKANILTQLGSQAHALTPFGFIMNHIVLNVCGRPQHHLILSACFHICRNPCQWNGQRGFVSRFVSVLSVGAAREEFITLRNTSVPPSFLPQCMHPFFLTKLFMKYCHKMKEYQKKSHMGAHTLPPLAPPPHPTRTSHLADFEVCPTWDLQRMFGRAAVA